MEANAGLAVFNEQYNNPKVWPKIKGQFLIGIPTRKSTVVNGLVSTETIATEPTLHKVYMNEQ